ncbi:centrosomal protein of 78 kDa [Athalia rosae]|uniref:centrosomal protein of 78 kDa n=1 Tax=Athalia rosae TaxID=37344 RepID=UPI0020336FFD|nr:centrosomal protein of 78 kDa [Athalia rosae]
MGVPTSQTFASCYMDLCKQQRFRPLPIISVTLPHSLDFTTDRVKMDDWGPILQSLSLDQTLRSIGIRSRYQCRKPLEEVNSEDKARAIGKAPVVLTRFLLEWLSHSVSQCVRNSPVLTSLELEGIPLPPDCLAVLCVGLAATGTLKNFSLQRCRIGDASCEMICRTVAGVKSIKSLNLSQCDLTFRCGPALAAALSRQKLELYHETWKDSLRYREPDFEAMPGLRRLTLNGNPQLGDFAAGEIIEAVRDSLWLKALDLHNCGLTDKTACQFLDLLGANQTLNVVDVRLNPAIRSELVDEIIGKLESRVDPATSEYRWMCLPQKSKPASTNADENRGFAAKTTLARSRSALGRQPKRPCRQVGPRRASTAISHRERRMDVKTIPRPLDLAKISNAIEDPEVAENPPRISLHVDLRAKIEDVAGHDDEENVADEIPPCDPKIEELVSRLNEAKMRQDQLLEENKRGDRLLAEEKVRRETAEAKLRSVNENLAELEAALKSKEKETRGYILISQQSVDEICDTFDRLLGMLDSVTRNPSALRNGNAGDEIAARETIKRHLAHLIRKSKSESHSRLNGMPDAASALQRESFGTGGVVRKSAKSEADIRTTTTTRAPGTPVVRVERNIGDSTDVTSPTREISGRIEDRKLFDSPGQRARAIFAQILRDGPILTIGSHVG